MFILTPSWVISSCDGRAFISVAVGVSSSGCAVEKTSMILVSWELHCGRAAGAACLQSAARIVLLGAAALMSGGMNPMSKW